LVEINSNLVEGLMDIGASMLIMSTTIVHKFGIMHLVSSFESNKTTSKVVTQALNKIFEFLIRIGDVQCLMTFTSVDTNNNDLLVGLDFLIKIGVVVDVEKGLIHVR
jgi:predicted aspartyl protease